MGWERGRGGRVEGCMQTAVRGGLLIPFIHPSIPRKTERRERDRRLVPRVWRQFVEKRGSGDCGTHGAQRRDGECSRGATVRPWTCRESVDTRFTVLPSCTSTPPFRLRPLSLPRLFWSEPKGGTIKPQDAFREDPVTRALALSSALTKSATEREETRPLRESLLVVVVWRSSTPGSIPWYPATLSLYLSLDGLLNIFLPLPRAHLRRFSPQFHGNEIHVLRLQLVLLRLAAAFSRFSAVASSVLYLSLLSNRYICRYSVNM